MIFLLSIIALSSIIHLFLFYKKHRWDIDYEKRSNAFTEATLKKNIQASCEAVQKMDDERNKNKMLAVISTNADSVQ